MAESKPEPKISPDALNKLREDAGYIPKKKDYEAMQRLLRWAMTPPDPYFSADETLESLMAENPIFIATRHGQPYWLKFSLELFLTFFKKLLDL